MSAARCSSLRDACSNIENTEISPLAERTHALRVLVADIYSTPKHAKVS